MSQTTPSQVEHCSYKSKFRESLNWVLYMFGLASVGVKIITRTCHVVPPMFYLCAVVDEMVG